MKTTQSVAGATSTLFLTLLLVSWSAHGQPADRRNSLDLYHVNGPTQTQVNFTLFDVDVVFPSTSGISISGGIDQATSPYNAPVIAISAPMFDDVLPSTPSIVFNSIPLAPYTGANLTNHEWINDQRCIDDHTSETFSEVPPISLSVTSV